VLHELFTYFSPTKHNLSEMSTGTIPREERHKHNLSAQVHLTTVTHAQQQIASPRWFFSCLAWVRIRARRWEAACDFAFHFHHHLPRWSRGRLQFKKGRMMRTSPRWTHRHYGLSQVAIRPQHSCHVTLGFSRHVVTISVITLSYDIKTGRSWMRWKGDDDAVVLDLVPAPEGLWIIL
jgi:hypothetical protein